MLGARTASPATSPARNRTNAAWLRAGIGDDVAP
jgi:hypothetical protein